MFTHVKYIMWFCLCWFVLGTVCTCAFWIVAPVLSLALPFFLHLGSWRMSRTQTSQKWQSQVRMLSPFYSKHKDFIRNLLVARHNILIAHTNKLAFIVLFLHFRPWLGVHCLPSSSRHDAFSSAVGSLLFHHDHPAGPRQSGLLRLLYNVEKSQKSVL